MSRERGPSFELDKKSKKSGIGRTARAVAVSALALLGADKATEAKPVPASADSAAASEAAPKYKIDLPPLKWPTPMSATELPRFNIPRNVRKPLEWFEEKPPWEPGQVSPHPKNDNNFQFGPANQDSGRAIPGPTGVPSEKRGAEQPVAEPKKEAPAHLAPEAPRQTKPEKLAKPAEKPTTDASVGLGINLIKKVAERDATRVE